MALVDEIKYGLQQQKQHQQQAPSQAELQQTARTAATGKVHTGTGGVAQASQIGRQMAQAQGQQQVQQVETAGQMQRAQQQQAADIQGQRFEEAARRLQSEKTMALTGLTEQERAKTQDMQFAFSKAASQNQHVANQAMREIDYKLKSFGENADVEEQLMKLNYQITLNDLANQKKMALIHQIGIRERLDDRNNFQIRMKEQALGNMYDQVIAKNSHLDDMMKQGIQLEEALLELDEAEQQDIADRLTEQALIQAGIGVATKAARFAMTGGV